MASIHQKCIFMPLLVLILAAAATAQNLKDIAESKNVFIGNIMSTNFVQDLRTDSGNMNEIVKSQFNALVLENDMKMSAVLPSTQPEGIHDISIDQLKEHLNREAIDVFINYCSTEIRKRGHAMIWFDKAPQWLDDNAPSWSAEQVFQFSKKYIFALGGLVGDQIEEWDVINEAIDQSSAGWRPETWYRNANNNEMTSFGEATYENYITKLFFWAREAQPSAKLFYNDFGIESFDPSPTSKNSFMLRTFTTWKSNGVPIDGIGFQSHFLLDDFSLNGELDTGRIDKVQQSMAKLAAAGLDVVITELDIRKCGSGTDIDQMQAYEEIVKMAMSQTNCNEVLIWGIHDGVSWIPDHFPGCGEATIYTSDYSPKAAWTGVQQALLSLP